MRSAISAKALAQARPPTQSVLQVPTSSFESTTTTSCCTVKVNMPYQVVCEVRPDKANPNHTRITIGGNRICYPGNVGTTTASLELLKLLVNSVLS
jgi:hypothetical protein